MTRINLLIVFLFVGLNSRAQDRNEIIQQRIELISEQAENEEMDLTNLFEQLNYFYDHPINLNNPDPEDLQSLGLLTDLQIADLQLHIRRFGKLITIYELQALAYWDMTTISNVLPFVRVDDKLDQLHISFREALKEGRFEWFGRYQRTPESKSGYQVGDSAKATGNYYYGNPDRYYTRFRYTYRSNISVGLTAEKDPGEQFFKGTQQKGFDFYSGHAYFKGGKYLKSAAIGDYLVQIGQGLNLWTGYAFGKTADVFASKKTAAMLRPYTSVDENRFCRGAAAVMGYSHFSLLTFYSRKQLDGAGISDSLTDELQVVSTIDLSGLHRTGKELAKKNRLTEQLFGGYLHYSAPRFNAGIALVNQSYSAPLERDQRPYNFYAFKGTTTTGLSADYSYVLKNVNLFGEVARSSHSNAFAQLHGLMAVLDPRVSVSLIYRNYAKDYYSFYNSGFSEGSATQNERGLFAGTKIKLNSRWSVSAYADLFSFSWLKYLINAPSNGNEFLVQPIFRPSKTLEIYARFRQQTRQKNSAFTDGTITGIEPVVQRNYRFNLDYNVNKAITLKSRIEYVSINRTSKANEGGWSISQDVLFKPKNLPIDLAVRYALFDTDSYDTRIYTFESNALYVFSVPAYYYQGSRAYALVRYHFSKQFDMWIRFGTFLYSNRESISSGTEMITGSRKSDITVQVRFVF